MGHKAFAMVEELGGKVGLKLNLTKCVVYARGGKTVEEARSLYPEGVAIVTSGVDYDPDRRTHADLLGSPFGDDDWIEARDRHGFFAVYTTDEKR